MPREDRRIIFDYEEVYKAVYALCMQKQLQKPPAGALRDVFADEDDQSIIVLRLLNPQNSDEPEIEVTYKRDFIAAALMLFCKGLGIPLPKTSKKSVLIRDGIVTLRVEI